MDHGAVWKVLDDYPQLDGLTLDTNHKVPETIVYRASKLARQDQRPRHGGGGTKVDEQVPLGIPCLVEQRIHRTPLGGEALAPI